MQPDNRQAGDRDRTRGGEEENDPRFEKEALQARAHRAKPASREHAAKINAIIDDALELKMISIRLQDGLIEALKEIADQEGIGYQPLIRQVLTRFAREKGRR